MLAAVFATFLAAGLVKGVTGMGLPTVAMGMLGALISPLVAASLLIVQCGSPDVKRSRPDPRDAPVETQPKSRVVPLWTHKMQSAT